MLLPFFSKDLKNSKIKDNPIPKQMIDADILAIIASPINKAVKPILSIDLLLKVHLVKNNKPMLDKKTVIASLFNCPDNWSTLGKQEMKVIAIIFDCFERLLPLTILSKNNTPPNI